ncbi:MAG: transposase family protein [Ideonella sp.]|nr:transposase family protein [Ideonella sp.]
MRIDSVHQGDWDGTKGLYHINAVDCVTQWQVVATADDLEAHLLPVIEQMLAQFPFLILGFHADNGSEYVNHRVAAMLEKLRIEFTRSRPRRSNDNGLARPRTAPLCAASSATSTSRNVTPGASTPSAPSTLTRS